MPTVPDLRSRLQRLRLQKVKRQLPPSVPPAALKPRSQAASDLTRTIPGQEVVTPLGVFQLIENVYPVSFFHGPSPLSAWLESDAAVAARLIGAQAPAEIDLRSLAFVDIETTGLAGGTGTLAFLVGVGGYTGEQFTLRQYFLRDPGEEEAMLGQLVGDLASAAAWVTFNGRAFDLPILETRLTLNRQRGVLGRRPNLDLLPPARRLYRGRLPSCALGDLEKHILRLVREQDDVPGELIPQMYLDYLRTGDASDMRRVIYHNAMDILSMVTLGAHLVEAFATPLEEEERRKEQEARREKEGKKEEGKGRRKKGWAYNPKSKNPKPKTQNRKPKTKNPKSYCAWVCGTKIRGAWGRRKRRTGWRCAAI